MSETKFKVSVAGITDVGLKREHNEDRILIADDIGLYAVADGMGGHAAGEIASETAIEALSNFVREAFSDDQTAWPFGMQEGLSRNENILYTGVAIANNKVCALAEENSAYGGMGTTLAAFFLAQDKAYICHVGDSRVYRYRDGELKVMTQDHSWVNEQVQRKIITEDEARTHRWRNVITRALGNRDEVEADIQTADPREGDLYLICSDGLSSMIDDRAIEKCVQENAGDIEGACRALIALANEAGGQDNISVVLVRVES